MASLRVIVLASKVISRAGTIHVNSVFLPAPSMAFACQVFGNQLGTFSQVFQEFLLGDKCILIIGRFCQRVTTI